ncbi:MAG: PTS transporter subunit EIIC [Victivallales bacterium]|nr:PTS transporter subunit EIIC [Victivallales bacterium]
MAEKKHSKLAENIIKLVGGKSNIEKADNCMTRLRIGIIDQSLVQKEKIKSLEGVLGLVEQSGQVQVVLGPGKVNKITDIVKEMLSRKSSQGKEKNINEVAVEARKNLKDKQKQRASANFVKHFANIFLPIIPAFVGCGIILGILNVLNRLTAGSFASSQLGMELALFGGLIYFGLNIFVGMNTAKEFGGTPVLGGIMAAVITTPGLSGLTIWGDQLIPGRGGVIAVVMLVIFTSWLEKKIRKYIPESLDLFVTSTLVILIGGLVALYFIQPIGGTIASGIAVFFKYLLANGGPFAGFIMAGLFLPLVMVGLHQGLIPIHAQLLQELGYNAFWPILAMAGGAQVGSAIAVYIKTDKKRLKNIIMTALPVGVLGIGEPLIYGVTLPLRRSFLAACLGAGVGGTVIAGFHVAVTAIGISGILCTIVSNKPLLYLIGLAASYIGGFVFTWLIGFDDSIYAEEE